MELSVEVICVVICCFCVLCYFDSFVFSYFLCLISHFCFPAFFGSPLDFNTRVSLSVLLLTVLTYVPLPSGVKNSCLPLSVFVVVVFVVVVFARRVLCFVVNVSLPGLPCPCCLRCMVLRQGLFQFSQDHLVKINILFAQLTQVTFGPPALPKAGRAAQLQFEDSLGREASCPSRATVKGNAGSSNNEPTLQSPEQHKNKMTQDKWRWVVC